jgi:regulator of replication initiation timing
MATIIPEEFANKTKEELFEDISALSRYVTKLRRDIEELQAQLTLKNGEIIKKRTDNFILKSEVGNQNIKIMDLEQQKNNIVDIDWQPPKEEK